VPGKIATVPPSTPILFVDVFSSIVPPFPPSTPVSFVLFSSTKTV